VSPGAAVIGEIAVVSRDTFESLVDCSVLSLRQNPTPTQFLMLTTLKFIFLFLKYILSLMWMKW
jgi:hypothetical protein